jgi:hypothetical protein
MRVMAHIPCQQYGFIEIEGTDADLPAIEKAYNNYSEKPLAFRGAPELVSSEDPGQVITTFTGEQVRYWPKEHKYRTMENKKMLSGSKFAEQFEEPFDRDRILGFTAKKRGSTVEKIGAAWDMRGLVSRNFGTAIHQAMELWFKHRDVEYGVMKHPFLKSMVETFPLKDEDIKSEVMVSDVKRLLVGQIDGLQVTGEMRGRVLDFKSDAEVSKNLERHSFQLSFYASILEAFGWTIEGLDIWNYTVGWKRYELERKEVKI